MINLSDFCGKDDPRTYINQPFNLNGRTIATNGHIMVSVSELKEYSENESKISQDSIDRILKGKPEVFAEFPKEYPSVEMVKCKPCNGKGKAEIRTCRECDGEGIVDLESDYNYYEVECKSCDGEGYQITKSTEEDCSDCDGTGLVRKSDSLPVKIGDSNVHVDAGYLELFSTLPNALIAPSTDGHSAFVKFDGGIGVIMGIRMEH